MVGSYFQDVELACRHCGLLELAPGFRDKLNILRRDFNHAMVINSACRCPVHNKAVGGKADSFHLTSHPWKTCAVDVSMSGWSSQQRHHFIKLASEADWSIGVNFDKNFIHIDRRSDYATGWPDPVFFRY